MSKLNATQSILLASAAQRKSGSLYPLPEILSARNHVAAAFKKLIDAALIEERVTTLALEEHRTESAGRFGFYITPAGLAAIGVEQAENDVAQKSLITTQAAPGRSSKASEVVAMLAHAGGATVSELIEATGWLPHTTRAVLTNLRQKGHMIERGKRGEVTCYRIVGGGLRDER